MVTMWMNTEINKLSCWSYSGQELHCLAIAMKFYPDIVNQQFNNGVPNLESNFNNKVLFNITDLTKKIE